MLRSSIMAEPGVNDACATITLGAWTRRMRALPVIYIFISGGTGNERCCKTVTGKNEVPVPQGMHRCNGLCFSLSLVMFAVLPARDIVVLSGFGREDRRRGE